MTRVSDPVSRGIPQGPRLFQRFNADEVREDREVFAHVGWQHLNP